MGLKGRSYDGGALVEGIVDGLVMGLCGRAVVEGLYGGGCGGWYGGGAMVMRL